jgi:hypothetical protein
MKKLKIILIVIVSLIIVGTIVFSIRALMYFGFFMNEFTDIEYTHIDMNKMTIVQDRNSSAGINWSYEVFPNGKKSNL